MRWVALILLLHTAAMAYFFRNDLAYDYWSDRLDQEMQGSRLPISTARKRLEWASRIHDGRESRARYDLAVVLMRAGQAAEAETLLHQSLEAVVAREGEKSELAALIRARLGRVYLDQAHGDKALPLLQSAATGLGHWFDKDDLALQLCQADLGCCLASLHRDEEARACLARVWPTLQDAHINPTELARIRLAWNEVHDDSSGLERK